MRRLKPSLALFLLQAVFATSTAIATNILLTTHVIPAQLAFEAVNEVVKTCAAQGYHESAVLVDAAGNQQAALRGDGAGLATLENADHKAYTAAAYQSNTKELLERSKSDPGMLPALNRLPRLLLAQGGMVIKASDKIIGAIGASGAPGGHKDDFCAKAGVRYIKEHLNK